MLIFAERCITFLSLRPLRSPWGPLGSPGLPDASSSPLIWDVSQMPSTQQRAKKNPTFFLRYRKWVSKKWSGGAKIESKSDAKVDRNWQKCDCLISLEKSKECLSKSAFWETKKRCFPWEGCIFLRVPAFRKSNQIYWKDDKQIVSKSWKNVVQSLSKSVLENNMEK